MLETPFNMPLDDSFTVINKYDKVTLNLFPIILESLSMCEVQRLRNIMENDLAAITDCHYGRTLSEVRLKPLGELN